MIDDYEMKRKLGALTLLIAIVVACSFCQAKGQTIEYPMPTVSAVEETGILFNRKGKSEQQQPERTQPVTPESAPLFESIPPNADTPAPIVVAPTTVNTSPTALTPEQKQALKGLILQVVTFLVGSMIGSGAASPFLKMILEKLLGAVGGATSATPPAAAPVRTRRRVAKKKKAAVKPAVK